MTTKKKTPQISIREYLDREAVLSEKVKDLILATVADNFDPRRCLKCCKKQLDNIYWEYLEAKGLADSTEARVDMMVDLLTLGWPKGVRLVGYGAISKVLLVTDTDVADASRLLRTLLTTTLKKTPCCNQ